MTDMTTHTPPPSFREIRLSAKDIVTRDVSLADLWECLRAGFDDYGEKPFAALPFVILFYFLCALLISLSAFGFNLSYFVFPMVAGFTLIGPIIAIGFFAMSRQREMGLKPRWSTAFDFIHTSSFAPVLALSVIMALLYIAWLAVAQLIYLSLFGDAPLTSFSAFVNQLFTTRSGEALIAYGNFVGLLFALTALALSVVAFPLALDKPVTSLTAMSVSFRAVTSNLLVMTVWGLVVALILVAGAALFLIGLAVALPVLGHATWHLYRKLVVP